MAMFYAVHPNETDIKVFGKRLERDAFLSEHDGWHKGGSHEVKTIMLHALRSDRMPYELHVKYRFVPMADLLHYTPMREIVDDYCSVYGDAE